MAKTNAEHQAEHRRRRSERMAALERENTRLARVLEDTEARLADALDENERLSAGAPSRCRRHGDELTCPACYRERAGGNYDD